MTHEHKLITEAHMTKPSIHDSIEFKSISTGGTSAGNGGDGYFKGDVINNPTLDFQPNNSAVGASVSVSTGDHVDQKAYWDAGKASAEGEKWSKAYANADANSNGDQSSKSGHDTSKVYANTDATQKNWLSVDQHQDVMAGIGGHGGDGSLAMGGSVDIQL
jgi:hypothetical protein